MRGFFAGSIVVVGMALASAATFAASPEIQTTPVPAQAKPDFSSMAFEEGSWSCSVMSARRPGPYIVTSNTSMSPDGYWMVTQFTVHKASWITTPFSGETKMSYDPSTHRWLQISSDDGGGYDFSTSPGWSGDKIVWTDVAYPKSDNTATSNPTTITKVSDSKTVSSSTFTEPGGRVVSVKTTCTKS